MKGDKRAKSSKGRNIMGSKYASNRSLNKPKVVYEFKPYGLASLENILNNKIQNSKPVH